MRIKKFMAPNMKEALMMIRKELGPEAVILKSEKVKSQGLSGKEMMEITAALDVGEEEYISTESLNSVATHQTDFRTDLFAFEEEQQEQKSIDIPTEPEYISFQFHEDRKISTIQKLLYKKEISFFNISQITKEILNSYHPSMDFPEIVKLFEKSLNRRVQVSGQLLLKRSRPTVIALIGPTGVGKTTTVAKLASNFTLFGKLDVGLITADTYRVAAVEQLKTFAKIIDISVKVVYKPQEIRESLDDFSTKNLILIDTAGRSQKNESQIQELQEILQYAQPDETHLVLNSTTKYSDNVDIIKRFGIIPIHRLIFTKIDETEYYGSIFNILQKVPKKISYITNGQNIPEDIELADPELFIKHFIGELNVVTTDEL